LNYSFNDQSQEVLI